MTKLRSYVREFNLQIGPISTVGHLYSILKPNKGNKPKFRYICPECEAPEFVSQQYTCAENHGPFTPGELERALQNAEGEWERVNAEEISEAKTADLLPNVMAVSVHPRDTFDGATRPDANAYVFVPNIVNNIYSLLKRLVAESNYVFVARCNIRNTEGFYKLDVWNDQVVVQKLYWPAEVNDFSAFDVEPATDEVFNSAAGMLERLATEFDPDEYQSETYAKLVALATGEAAPRSPKADPSEDLISMLEAFG